MNLTLASVCGPEATTGTLSAGALVLATMEPPWRHNAPNESCVPAGEFLLIPYLSPRHGATWRLHAPELGIWGRGALAPEGTRTEIELHCGDWATDTKGCILVGLTAGRLVNPRTGREEAAVLQSRLALDQLRALLDDSEEDSLTIVRAGIASPEALR